MATATKTARFFAGEDDEDVVLWLRDIKTLAWAMSYDESSTIRYLVTNLKGKALTWAASIIEKSPTISQSEFIEQLKIRFSPEGLEDKILNRFLNTKIAKTRDEFKQMIDDATRIKEGGIINLRSLAKQFIVRCPPEMKAYLFQAAYSSWDEFIKSAENAVWMAYPDKIPSAADFIPQSYVVAPTSKRKWSNKLEKFCAIHGKNGHSSEECKTIAKLESAGWRRNKKSENRSINSIEEDSEENKNSLNYSSPKNPFYKRISINKGKKHLGLIDTGADVSLINIENLPADVKIIKSNQYIQSTTGNPLKIIGKVENVDLEIQDKTKKIRAYVNKGNPKYSIIGVDNLIKHPQLLSDEIKNLSNLRTSFGKKLAISNTISLENNFFTKYHNLFQTEISEYTLSNIGKHEICLTSEQPIWRSSQRIPVAYEKQISEEIAKLVKLGILRPSESSWSSRIVPVPKPDGSVRLCIDYRPLNEVTCKDRYPLPRIDEILDALGKAKIFSTLDATSGYYQIAMKEEDIKKTAFASKNGFFEFTRMPFGLCNAPATFQRAMDQVFKKDKWKFVIPYLDDIIVFSENIEEHIQHVEIVLSKLQAAGIKLNQKKCHLFRNEIKILGYTIREGIIKMDPKRVEAIKELSLPNTISELRSFLGIANFCRDFLPKFSEIAAPLENLLKGELKKSKKKIHWNETSIEAFKKLKLGLISNTERNIPDLEKEFILITDASSIAIGAILAQYDTCGKLKIISAFSKKMDKAQTNYSVTDKELLGLVKSIDHYRHYLLGREFQLWTDHKALEYMKNAKDPAGRLLRWALTLQEYKFTVKYIKGEENLSDILSRPTINQVNYQNATLDCNKCSKETIETILSEYHIKSGHGSNNTMKFLLKDKYNWKTMYKDIENFTSQCKICLKAGLEKKNTKNKIISTSSPNELWEVDLIGRIPLNDDTSMFIFTAIDHYTKWIETMILKEKSGKEVYNAVKKLIISKHGIPQRILSDCGSEFNNPHIRELEKECSITWEYSSPYHHNTVGAIERANATFMTKLKKMTDFGRSDWQEAVELATLATNISFNRSINTSPYRLKFGHDIKLKIDEKLGIPIKYLPLRQMRENRDNHWKTYTAENIMKGEIRIARNIPISSRVLIFRENSTDKFSNHWFPGFHIKDYIGTDAYLVTDGIKNYRINKKHVKLDTSKEEREMSECGYIIS